MPTASRYSRIFLVSPWFLLVFLVIPGVFLASYLWRLSLPLPMITLMLVNAACLLVCVAARFVHYLARFTRQIRYGADCRRASLPDAALKRPAEEVRDELRGVGFHFTDDGTYAEKRDFGYIGTVVFYGGILLLTLTALHDNLRQFSGTTLHGIGVPVALDNPKIYYPLIEGPLASVAGLPLLAINKQFFPGKEYPKGATDVVLVSHDKKPLAKKRLVVAGEPLAYRGFDIHLAKLLVDAWLSISHKGDAEPLFNDAVKLSPLWKNEGPYGFYGTFASPRIGDGEMFYDSTRNAFRIVLYKGGKKYLDTVYEFQQYRNKTDGDYTLEIAAAGWWSELHVVHRRHMAAIAIGALLAVAGLMVRIVIRPQRVWLEGSQGESRVWARGRETRKLLNIEG